MRAINADIAYSGELHKLYLEYARDRGLTSVTPTLWLNRFSSPTFFCLLMKHGKKPVGFLMGQEIDYFEEPGIHIEAVFIRRQFRGKIKWTRGFMGEVKQFLTKSKITKISYSKVKPKERKWQID